MGIEGRMIFGQILEFRGGLIRRVAQTADPPPGWEEADPLHL